MLVPKIQCKNAFNPQALYSFRWRRLDHNKVRTLVRYQEAWVAEDMREYLTHDSRPSSTRNMKIECCRKEKGVE